MKIQLSFDTSNTETIIFYAKQFEPYFDQIAISALPLYTEGVELIKIIKSEFPKKTIVAKIRLTDYAQNHSLFFASLGVNILSIIPGTSMNMMHAAIVAIHEKNMKIMLEIFDPTFINQPVLEAKSLGVDSILFHYLDDKKNSQTFLEQWEFIKGNINLPTFIETTITDENLQTILSINPDGIVFKEEFIKSKNAFTIIKELYESTHKN